MTAGGKEGKMENLKALSYDLRKNVVDMIMEGKGGHGKKHGKNIIT